jgi:glycosyltransferase involved in cell wall biosynthesis
VSIIIATNRDSPYLADAIAAVVAQTERRWELVVVDNGVPDPEALAAVLDGVAHVLVRIPPPVTVSLARNAGAAAAQGELLVFLDDDDTWHPERLERQIAALTDAPDAPASYCGGWHMDAAGRPFAPAWPAAPATAAEMLAGRSRMPHICGAMLIRREAFAQVGGFSPELVMMEDFELAVRLLGRGTFACVPDELVGYRRHDRNTTNTSLANVRVRREAVGQILSRHAWAAEVRGDSALSGLLEEHRSRERRRDARDAGGSALSSLRAGRMRDAAREAGWGLRNGAGSFVGGVIRRLIGRL